MAILSALTLANAKAPAGSNSGSDPLKYQRTRLLDALSIQRELAQGLRDGKAVQVKRVQRVPKEGGGSEKKEVVINTRAWYWQDPNTAHFFFELRYANKQLPLSKEAPVVDCGKDKTKVVEVVETLFKAVQAGELDDQLRAAANGAKKSA